METNQFRRKPFSVFYQVEFSPGLVTISDRIGEYSFP